jgi:hypothetical protein
MLMYKQTGIASECDPSSHDLTRRVSKWPSIAEMSHAPNAEDSEEHNDSKMTAKRERTTYQTAFEPDGNQTFTIYGRVSLEACAQRTRRTLSELPVAMTLMVCGPPSVLGSPIC